MGSIPTRPTNEFAKLTTQDQNVGVLTRILDGQGYETDSGIHGYRDYTRDYGFSLLAATTPLSAATWRAMARMGNRILMLDVGSELVSSHDSVASMRCHRIESSGRGAPTVVSNSCN